MEFYSPHILECKEIIKYHNKSENKHIVIDAISTKHTDKTNRETCIILFVIITYLDVI